MKSKAWWSAVAVMALAVSAPVAAQVGPAACVVPQDEGHPLAERQGRLSQYERLPDHCLKTLVMECSTVANQQLLDMGSAATCSMGYEVLLRRGFGGDFQAMLAWWRTQQGSQVN